MKKRIALLFLGLASLFCAQAQSEVGSWTLIPKVGVNWAKTTTPDIYYMAGPQMGATKLSPQYKAGLVAGAELEYQHLQSLSWSAGLLYSQQGRTFDNADTEPSGLRNMKTTLDYLNIPVMAHLYLAKGLAVEAGGQLGILLHKRGSEEEVNLAGVWTKNEDSTWHRWWDISIPVGVSYAFDNGLQLDVRYNLGLNDIGKYSTSERNRVLQLTVGYRFHL